MALVSQVATATFEEIAPELYDNFTNNNAFLAHLRDQDNLVEDNVGGEYMRANLTYAENGSYDRYTGRERVSIAENDILTCGKFAHKQVSVAVVMDGLEQDVQNIGEAALVELMQAKVDVAEMTFENNFEIDLFSDGTASGGRQIGGLQLLIADSPSSGTVGGIDRSLYSWWRNISYDATTDGGAPASAVNIKSYLDAAWRQVVRKKDKPTFYLADNNYYSFYEQHLGPLQTIARDSGSESGAVGTGWDELAYRGRPFVLAGGQGGAIPANHVYGVCGRHIKLKEAKNRKFKPRPSVKSIDQDLEVTLFLWAGNLMVTNCSVHFVLKD